MTEQEIRERHFVEQIGLWFSESGAQRMVGRILGTLLICDPPHQSSSELADYLDASRGAISQGTRMLLRMGLIEKVPVQGSRATYFRVRQGAWSQVMLEQLTRLRIVRELAESGLALKADDPDGASRLQEFHDFYAYMEREMPMVIADWEREQKESES